MQDAPDRPEDPFPASMKALRSALGSQQSGFKMLTQKASKLEIMSKKTRSPDVEAAINGLLEVLEGLKSTQDNVAKAFIRPMSS